MYFKFHHILTTIGYYCLLFFFSFSVELVEPLVIAIIEKALEFCMQLLEESSYNGDDFSLQVHFIMVINCCQMC